MNAYLPPLGPWSDFLQTIRGYFLKEGFYEATPAYLVEAGAFESSIDTLKVTWNGGSAELPSSPEMALKGILAKEKKSLFSLGRSFRDDPATGIHFKEFQMLEFYRVGADYLRTQQDVLTLIGLLGPLPRVRKVSVSDAFQEATGIDLSLCAETESLRSAIKERKVVALSGDESWESLFFKVWIEKVETALPPGQITLVYDYPRVLSTLAKSKGNFAERFEIYWQGLEICNGATELGDAKELARNYELESELRKKEGKSPHPYPKEFFSILSAVPPCSGVAVGLERLFWCLNPQFRP